MKRKRILTIGMAIVMFGLSLLSCNDDKDQVRNDTYIVSQTLGKNTTIPANSTNVFDSVGAMHNTEVDKIMTELLSRYGTVNNLEASTVYEVIGSRLVSEGFYSSFSSFEREVPISFLNSIASDTANLYSNIIRTANLSNNTKSYLNRLFSTLEDKAQTTDNYLVFKNSIMEIERDIIGTNTLSTSEKNCLLKTTSIARYSIYYWFYFENELPTKNKISIWDRIAVAGADIAAFAVTENLGVAVAVSSFVKSMIEWDKSGKPNPQQPVDTNKNGGK